jgi:hypothetical protein
MNRFALITLTSLTALAGLVGNVRADIVNGPVYCYPDDSDPDYGERVNKPGVKMTCENAGGGDGQDHGGENGAPPKSGIGYTIPAPPPGAIYRLVSVNTGDHLLTANHDEAVNADNYAGYGYEGIIGVFVDPRSPDAKPLYRSWLLAANDHFYSASSSEGVNAGYSNEGVAGYVYTWWHAGTCPLFRTRVGAHHFFTSSPTERSLVLSHGGADEGIAGYVLPYGSSCPN